MTIEVLHGKPEDNFVRRLIVHPGYNCREQCDHDPKGDHGIASDLWLFGIVSKDRTFAISLEVSSGKYPASTGRRHQIPFGIDLGYHKARATSVDQARDKPTKDCVMIDGACYSDGSSLRGLEFWKRHGGDAMEITEVSEALWIALEQRFQIDYAAHCARPTWVRCLHCDGQGYLPEAVK